MGADSESGATGTGGMGQPAGILHPRRRVNAAACVEAAWGWFAILAGGLLLASAVLLALQRQEVQALRDARLEITLEELRERLEADLLLGFDLADSGRAQDLLADTLARDPSLLSAEVFDAAGLSLFNTDRGSIGERVPAAWLEAIARQPASRPAEAPAMWSAEGGDAVLGLPLRGPFGEVVGHVSVTSSPVPRPEPQAFLWTSFVMFGLLCVLAGGLVYRALRRWDHHSDGTALERAAARLAATQARLEKTLARLAGDEGRVS